MQICRRGTPVRPASRSGAASATSSCPRKLEGRPSTRPIALAGKACLGLGESYTAQVSDSAYNADLLFVHSAEEYTFIAQMLARSFSLSQVRLPPPPLPLAPKAGPPQHLTYYVGLVRRAGGYSWTSGEFIHYTNWHRHSPSADDEEACVLADKVPLPPTPAARRRKMR